jgi:sugar lactone lactonase YvrE
MRKNFLLPAVFFLIFLFTVKTAGALTPTPTNTTAVTFTPTVTVSTTITPTPPVPTATFTVTPTPTLLPANTATATPTATFTPVPTTACCQGVSSLAGFLGPAGMAIDGGRNRLYVADFENNRMQVFNSQTLAGPTTIFSSLGAGSLNLPIDAAVDGGGNLYIADEGNEAVEKFDSNYTYVCSIGNSLGQSVVSVCTQGTTIYFSTLQNVVLGFTGSGASYSAASTFGGAGLLSNPNEMVAVGTWLYVADSNHGQIVKFNTTVSESAPMTVKTGLSHPSGLRTDANGYFYVTETNNGSAPEYLDTFSPDFGTLEKQCLLSDTWGIAVNSSEEVFVSGFNSTAVTVIQGCRLPPPPTPTPFYQGANPPGAGDCFIYPSPVRGGQATVSYEMTSAGSVDLKIWNEAAERVAEVTDQKSTGVQVTPFSVAGFASGVYFYTLTLSYGSGDVEKLPPHKFVIIH